MQLSQIVCHLIVRLNKEYFIKKKDVVDQFLMDIPKSWATPEAKHWLNHNLNKIDLKSVWMKACLSIISYKSKAFLYKDR